MGVKAKPRSSPTDTVEPSQVQENHQNLFEALTSTSRLRPCIVPIIRLFSWGRNDFLSSVKRKDDTNIILQSLARCPRPSTNASKSETVRVSAEMVSRPDTTPTALVSLFIWTFHTHHQRRRLHPTTPDFSASTALPVRLMSAEVMRCLTEQQWGAFSSSIRTRMMFWWPVNIFWRNRMKAISSTAGG